MENLNENLEKVKDPNIIVKTESLADIRKNIQERKEALSKWNAGVNKGR